MSQGRPESSPRLPYVSHEDDSHRWEQDSAATDALGSLIPYTPLLGHSLYDELLAPLDPRFLHQAQDSEHVSHDGGEEPVTCGIIPDDVPTDTLVGIRETDSPTWQRHTLLHGCQAGSLGSTAGAEVTTQEEQDELCFTENEFDLAELDQWAPDKTILSELQTVQGSQLKPDQLLCFGYTGDSTPDTLPCGLVLDNIRPIQPPDHEFLWETTYRPKALLDPILSPPPSLEPPSSFSYPQSPNWTLQEDSRYSSGVHYSAAWSSSHEDLRSERKRMMSLTMPPNCTPIWNDHEHCFVILPIPGAINLIPGVPFVQYVDGDPSRYITIACAQTLSSLSVFPEFDEIHTLTDKLVAYTLGSEADDLIPIYTLEGLKRNDRSPKHSSTPNGQVCYDGSYSLAGTVEKGRGLGTVVPAVQAAYPQARDHISTVLQILHRLYQLVMRHCVSKREWDLMNFNSNVNNVFSFGGLEPGGTAVQMNVSSGFSGGSLEDMIGHIQGRLHSDSGDNILYPSFFVLIFKLPKGADHGPFLLGRFGLYFREEGIAVVFLTFRGNDLHSGSAPSAHPSMLFDESKYSPEEIANLHTLSAFAVNRVGYVVYHSFQATQRTTASAISPATYFGNHGALTTSETRSHNFTQDGRHTLGTSHEATSRLVWEATMNYVNALSLAGAVHLDDNVSTILARISYRDPATQQYLPIHPIAHDPLNPAQAESIDLWRGYYKWAYLQCACLSLGIRKHHFNACQKKLREQSTITLTQEIAYSLYEVRRVGTSSKAEAPSQLTPPPHTVTSIVRKFYSDGKTMWHVQLNTGCLLIVNQQDDPWILHPLNRQPFLQYLDPNTTPGLSADTTRSAQTTSVAANADLPSSAGAESFPLPDSDSDIASMPETPHPSSVPIPTPQPGHTILASEPLNSADKPDMPQNSRQAEPLRRSDRRLQKQRLEDLQPTPSDPSTKSHCNLKRKREHDPPVKAIPAKRPKQVTKATDAREKETHDTPVKAIPVERPKQVTKATDAREKETHDPPVQAILANYPKQVTKATDAQEKETNLACGGSIQYLSSANEIGLEQDKEIKESARTDDEGESEIDEVDCFGNFEPAWTDRTDVDWEVEDIVGHTTNNKGVISYEVLFKGFPPSYNLMRTEKQLPDAKAMLRKYKNSVDIENVQHRRKEPPKGDLFSHGLLGRLFDPEVLSYELDTYREMYAALGPTRASFLKQATSSETGALQEVFRFTQRQTQCEDWLAFCPLDDSPSSLEQHANRPQTASLLRSFQRVADATHIMPIIHEQYLKTTILTAFLRWQYCRCLLVIYDFLSFGLVRLANILFDAYEQPKLGTTWLREHYLVFAPLVERIGDYVKEQRRLKRSETNKKSPNQYRRIPHDLYGLRSPGGGSSHTEIELPDVGYPRRSGDAHRQCFTDLFERELVLPFIPDANACFNSVRRRSKNPDEARALAIAHGAVIRTFVDHMGDEWICMCPSMHQLLISPTLLFFSDARSERRIDSLLLASSARYDPHFLDPLRIWLKENVHDDSRDGARVLGEFIHRSALEFHTGRMISEDQYYGHTPDVNDSHTDEEKLVGRKRRNREDGPSIVVSTSSLLIENRPPHYGTLGLPLREALNQAKQLPPGSQSCAWFLQGHHPIHGPTSHPSDPDQVSPIRQFNTAAKLLAREFTPKVSTQETALCNLLTFLGTGQSWKTTKFLQFVRTALRIAGQPRTFISDDLSSCISMFGSALMYNEACAAQRPDVDFDPEAESPPGAIETMVQISNSRIYGSACNLLKLLPSSRVRDDNGKPIKFSLMQKLSPYWTRAVIHKWIAFLGEMLNQNPHTFQGRKKGWLEAVEMIVDLGIPGFMGGLTTLQVANSLVFLGICTPPDIDTISRWIWNHPELGAFKGLRALGFKLSSFAAVRAAFTCVYTHLDQSLSTKDKALVGFGTLFVEHLLCKGQRWAKRVKEFTRWVELAEAGQGVWKQGTNDIDHEVFPFPLIDTIERIESVLCQITI